MSQNVQRKKHKHKKNAKQSGKSGDTPIHEVHNELFNNDLLGSRADREHEKKHRKQKRHDDEKERKKKKKDKKKKKQRHSPEPNMIGTNHIISNDGLSGPLSNSGQVGTPSSVDNSSPLTTCSTLSSLMNNSNQTNGNSNNGIVGSLSNTPTNGLNGSSLAARGIGPM